MMLDAPAESTPNTPALLKQIRESGVSPMLTLLTDEQLKDPGIAADAVRSLTPAALATVGLRNADGERGTHKRRREADPAPRGKGAPPPPPARKHAAKADDIDIFSDDDGDDDEHDPSDKPVVVKQTTFPLLQLASSMKLNMEPVVAGYAWSNALCAVTAGLSVDSDRNRDYSLLVIDEKMGAAARSQPPTPKRKKIVSQKVGHAGSGVGVGVVSRWCWFSK